MHENAAATRSRYRDSTRLPNHERAVSGVPLSHCVERSPSLLNNELGVCFENSKLLPKINWIQKWNDNLLHKRCRTTTSPKGLSGIQRGKRKRSLQPLRREVTSSTFLCASLCQLR
jgi:hypothetical protein